ncbi:MAG: hypothetical protein BWY79_02173 [Actinobacteria bacterium ADurb.Bin444]|nr:MAG: hypothetical protein BWY79_02173 [Actinobacteria bacterium ADurb.Bin444]
MQLRSLPSSDGGRHPAPSGTVDPHLEPVSHRTSGATRSASKPAGERGQGVLRQQRRRGKRVCTQDRTQVGPGTRGRKHSLLGALFSRAHHGNPLRHGATVQAGAVRSSPPGVSHASAPRHRRTAERVCAGARGSIHCRAGTGGIGRAPVGCCIPPGSTGLVRTPRCAVHHGRGADRLGSVRCSLRVHALRPGSSRCHAGQEPGRRPAHGRRHRPGQSRRRAARRRARHHLRGRSGSGGCRPRRPGPVGGRGTWSPRGRSRSTP